jgi:hypothetical protein
VLLAVLGLGVWATVTAQQRRHELAQLERRLAEREGALAAAHRSLANAERQLAAARGHIHDLEKEQRASPIAVASREIAVTVAPWFAVRGQENSGSGLLQGDAVNPVRIPARGKGFTVALSLADHPVYGEYRLELTDRNGEVLWAGRRPGRALLGDMGTSISVSGLGPGLYRLRIEGVQGKRSELLAEYRLAVER